MDEVTRPRPTGSSLPAAPVLPLRFDDEADAPIGFALTVAGRRVIEPDARPALRVVAPFGPPPRVRTTAGVTEPPTADAAVDPGDTRPARARALLRAGVPVPTIAERLGGDTADVARWVEGVRPPRAQRAARQPVRAAASTGGGRAAPEARASIPRRGAVSSARTRLTTDAAFARDVGVVAAALRRTGPTAVLTLDRVVPATAVVRRLVEECGLDAYGLRVVLRVGPGVEGDRARHDWSEALGVPLDRVAAVRWQLAPDPGLVEAAVHVVDEAAVSALVTWVEAADAAIGTTVRPTAGPVRATS